MIYIKGRFLFPLILITVTIVFLSFVVNWGSPFGVVKRYVESLNEPDSFAIKRSNIVRWKEVPYEYVKSFGPTRYMERFDHLQKKAYYMAVNYTVSTETKHHLNGLNYFFVVVVKEEGEWKIALTPKPPIKSVVEDGYGFGTNDEWTYDERRLQVFQ